MKRRPSARAIAIAVLVLLLVGFCGGLTLLYQSLIRNLRQAGAPQLNVDTVTRQDLVLTASLNGKLEAFRSAELAFGSPGRIAEVMVEPGDIVQQDQPLARLETRDLELEVQLAKAALAQAQASYEKLTAGVPPERLAEADQAIAQARSSLEQARRSVTAQDLRAAQARVDVAATTLGQLQGGGAPADQAEAARRLDSARNAQAQAQLQAEQQRAQASLAKTRAQSALDQSANALREIQAQYSAAQWKWDYVERTGYDPSTQNQPTENLRPLNDFERRQYQDALAQAELTLHDAEENTRQAQVAYDQALRDEQIQAQQIDTQLHAAQLAVQEAEAALALLRQPPAQQLATARANLADARANLERLQTQSSGSGVAAAEAALRSAEENKAALLRGATEADLAEVQAQVDQSQARLEQAETALADATLRAPWSGTVIDVALRAGEITGAGTTMVTLADRSRLLLRGQVDEIDVLNLEVGQTGEIRVDALPTTVMTGTITEVAQAATASEQGGGQSGFASTYTVLLEIAGPDQRIRLGMAAFGQIETYRKPGALVIPRRALREEDGQTYVERVVEAPPASANPSEAPRTERVPVEVGQRTEDLVEIIAGLNEGDSVSSVALPSATPAPED